MTVDAHHEAARCLALYQSGTKQTNEAIGRLDEALQCGDTAAFQAETRDLLINICNDIAELGGAISHLIDPEELRRAQDEVRASLHTPDARATPQTS